MVSQFTRPIQPRIVYSRHYNIGFFGLERLHPFDTRKYGRAYRLLRRRFGRRLAKWTVRPAAPMRHKDLRIVHNEAYLQRLRDPDYLARVLEVAAVRRAPASLTDWCVLRPMRWATAGTVLAATLALKHGLSINLSGGYHHAGPDRGEGFCVYNDIALAVHTLRASGALGAEEKVVYVDLDAHQGNGVCRAFVNDARVFIYDQYNRSIYPADPEARRRIDCAVPLPHGCSEAECFGVLRTKLEPFLDAVTRTGRVGLSIYNAGSDIYEGDALGGMCVSAAGVCHRDNYVIEQLTGRGYPTLMLLSGGYSPQSYRIVADSIGDILEKFAM